MKTNIKEIETEFNYCIGRYWEGNEGSIGCYAFGSEVKYGTLKDAKNFLKYVQSQNKEKKYKIFKVVEL